MENVKLKLDLVEAWCRDGATEQQIADKLNIFNVDFIKL